MKRTGFKQLSYEEARESFKPLNRAKPLRASSPMPRSKKPLTAKTRLKAIGKKGSEWIAVRRELKKRFEWAGITTCEARLTGCWFHESLGFAHCRKRRELRELEIWHVALLCNACHDKWEVSGHENMHEKIHAIIDKRGLLVPPSVLQQIQESENRSRRDSLPQQERSATILRP